MVSSIDTIGTISSPDIFEGEEGNLREVMKISATRIRELADTMNNREQQIEELRAEVRTLADAILPDDMFQERVDTGYILDTGRIINHLEDELAQLQQELLTEIFAQQTRLRAIF